MQKIGVLIYDGVAEMDFVGPFEVLSDVNKIKPDSAVVYLVAESKVPVRAFNGMCILPEVDFTDCPKLDVLIVPGGKGRFREMENLKTREFILRQRKCARYIASVCTGAFILAEAGLLQGKRATTFHECFAELSAYSDVFVEKKKVIADGGIITAAGVTSGLELGFCLLKLLFSENLALQTAGFMEYDLAESVLALGAADPARRLF